MAWLRPLAMRRSIRTSLTLKHILWHKRPNGSRRNNITCWPMLSHVEATTTASSNIMVVFKGIVGVAGLVVAPSAIPIVLTRITSVKFVGS
jgi:hypothetical protein